MDAAGYEKLADVLRRAYEQAAQDLIKLYGVGGGLGQAGKKAQESQRMVTASAVRELLGAINYLAGAVIALEAQNVGPQGWGILKPGVKMPHGEVWASANGLTQRVAGHHYIYWRKVG